MHLHCGPNTVRPWQASDLAALIANANDAEIAGNMRDGFPHPYGLPEARSWLAFVALLDPIPHFAIEHHGEFCGAIGYLRKDGDARFTAEVGYWVGRKYWNRGIVTAVLPPFVDHLFRTTEFVRVEARVLPWNPASSRVLEKAGFGFEGRLRRAQWKNGAVHDTLLYSKVRVDAV